MGMAAMSTVSTEALPEANTAVAELGGQGRRLVALQALQIATGLLGQFCLLARWSSYPETDLFLLLSSVPWIAAACVVLGNLELSLPAALHRVAQGADTALQERFHAQVAGLTLVAATVAALVSAAVIAVSAIRLGMSTLHALVMGVALGGQVVPFALADLRRGYLMAHHRVLRVRWTYLVGVIVVAVGYAAAPGAPGIVLPLIVLGGTLAAALAAWLPCRIGGASMLRSGSLKAARRPWHPEIARLASNLAALSVAAGALHAEMLMVRAAVLSLGTGAVTALSVALRGWDAVIAVIVAASTLAAYPHWARGHPASRRLLVLSLLRTGGLTLAAAAVAAVAFAVFGPRLANVAPLAALTGAVQMAWVLLPRFILLSGIQPLVLHHYATGSSWLPVLASALGLAVLAGALWVCVPLWGLAGLAIALAAGVVPGWILLGWRASREVRSCAS